MRWKLIVGMMILALLAVGGCTQPTDRAAGPGSGKPQVLVTNYPLEYFARRVAGEAVDLHFPMEADGDPAFWQPDPATIGRYQAADLILINGATYEKWIASATLPESKIVSTSIGFRDDWIKIEAAVTHSHGPEGEHSHAGTAFTTWIDFQLAQRQADAILAAVQMLLADNVDAFEQNHAQLVADLKALDQQMSEIAGRIGDQPLVASHPVYDYLARRYKLNVQSVHWEPDVVPTDEQVAELKAVLDKHAAKVMIWEGTPAAESVAKLNEMGIASLVFDPCGNTPDSGDWLTVMRQNLDNMSAWIDAQKAADGAGAGSEH